jgi:hypothetical protein
MPFRHATAAQFVKLFRVGVLAGLLAVGGHAQVAQAGGKVALPDIENPLPQDSMLPAAPAVEPDESTLPPHKFWDRTNILLFTGVGVFRGLDFASTRNMLARGREEILLTNDAVKNNASFTAIEAGATGTSIALSYWLHRTGHHKLERWLSIGHIGVTGFGVARNYALKTKH